MQMFFEPESDERDVYAKARDAIGVLREGMAALVDAGTGTKRHAFGDWHIPENSYIKGLMMVQPTDAE